MVHTSLPKVVLIPVELTVAASATDTAIKKEDLWIRDDYTDNLKRRNETYNENN